jgi:hypothetical protein
MARLFIGRNGEVSMTGRLEGQSLVQRSSFFMKAPPMALRHHTEAFLLEGFILWEKAETLPPYIAGYFNLVRTVAGSALYRHCILQRRSPCTIVWIRMTFGLARTQTENYEYHAWEPLSAPGCLLLEMIRRVCKAASCARRTNNEVKRFVVGRPV